MNDIFIKQKDLEQQSRKLATQTSKYVSQTQQWLSLVDNFNNSLKELGDVKNWAQIMENDMKTIMSTLEFVHQGKNKRERERERLMEYNRNYSTHRTIINIYIYIPSLQKTETIL